MSGILTSVAGILVGAGAPPPTPPTILYSATIGGSAGGFGFAGIDTRGANLIVIGASWYTLASPAPTLTDSEGNTWTPLTLRSSGSISDSILYYCFNPVVGAAVSFGFAGGSTYGSGGILVASGIASSPFDGENGATALATSTISSGSVTPTQAGSLMISFIGYNAADGTNVSVGNGFTLVGSTGPISGGYLGCGMAYKIVTNGASADADWTSGAVMPQCGASLGAFKF